MDYCVNILFSCVFCFKYLMYVGYLLEGLVDDCVNISFLCVFVLHISCILDTCKRASWTIV